MLKRERIPMSCCEFLGVVVWASTQDLTQVPHSLRASADGPNGAFDASDFPHKLDASGTELGLRVPGSCSNFFRSHWCLLGFLFQFCHAETKLAERGCCEDGG